MMARQMNTLQDVQDTEVHDGELDDEEVDSATPDPFVECFTHTGRQVIRPARCN